MLRAPVGHDKASVNGDRPRRLFDPGLRVHLHRLQRDVRGDRKDPVDVVGRWSKVLVLVVWLERTVADGDGTNGGATHARRDPQLHPPPPLHPSMGGLSPAA